jgi:hypothetical protein
VISKNFSAYWGNRRSYLKTLRSRLLLLQDTLRPRGRPPRTDDEYQRIARSYLAKLAARAEANRTTEGIVAEIAADEGKPKNTIRGWIYGARQRGFLTKSIPGHAGATPGARLLLQTPIPGRAGAERPGTRPNS